MDAKLKSKWVKALRGGKFAQARGKLYDGHGYCCLGVLGRVVCGTPKDKLLYKQAFGNKDINAVLPSIKTRKKLAEMNDYGKSFTEIANYIEANL